MTTPISTALKLVADIEAGKQLDPEAIRAVLWQLVNALRRQ